MKVLQYGGGEIEALREYFSIELTSEEREGIRGRVKQSCREQPRR